MSNIPKHLLEAKLCNKDTCKLVNKIPNNDDLQKMIAQLVVENARLKELCDKYEEEHRTTFEIWKNDIQKIDKAIEHIKKYQYWNGDNYNCLHCEELLEILGDKERK